MSLWTQWTYWEMKHMKQAMMLENQEKKKNYKDSTEYLDNIIINYSS